jgi:glycerol-3-phosphate responsive antiterminator
MSITRVIRVRKLEHLIHLDLIKGVLLHYWVVQGTKEVGIFSW